MLLINSQGEVHSAEKSILSRDTSQTRAAALCSLLLPHLVGSFGLSAVRSFKDVLYINILVLDSELNV